jgi:hypothetical protein
MSNSYIQQCNSYDLKFNDNIKLVIIINIFGNSNPSNLILDYMNHIVIIYE